MFRLNLPDSSIFVSWRCPEGHSANFVVIQKQLDSRGVSEALYDTVTAPGYVFYEWKDGNYDCYKAM